MHRYHNGFIALITVMLVAAFIIVAGTSIALMNADELLAAYSWLQTEKASRQADSCVDNIIARARNNSSLTGNVNITVGNVSCIGLITSSGNIRTINARATSTDAFNQNTALRVIINVNIATNPFTIVRYKDILQ